jgi:23S rRNA (guanosine2251-2'-O)-methyltransferase
VVGQHAILEALQTHPQWVESLWLREGFESSQELKKLHLDFRNKVSKVEIKQEAILERLGASHQGAALLMSQAPQLDWAALAEKKISRVVLLDGIEDPHNLGAILRTAWLQKVDAILLPQDRTVRLTPTVHKVACGGAEHVPIEICHNFSNALEELKKMGYWVFGLSHTGKNTLFEMKIPEKIVWCIGAEDKGLRSTTERLCDELVRIPQANAAASYNASVATGMALLETQRQQDLIVK